MARNLLIYFSHILKTDTIPVPSHFEVRHKKGFTFRILLTASLIRNQRDDAVGFRGTFKDIGEQYKTLERHKRLQTQFFQAQKMEALGTLAGGLAHGFNNVLMAIQGNLSLMRLNLSPADNLHKHLERIGRSTEKGIHLAKQILSFAKIGKFVVMSTNLNQVLQSTSRMFIRSNPGLKFHEFYQSDLWETRVDRVQIGQLLLSLYMQAAEAMPDGGDIYLHSENVVLDNHYTRAYDIDVGKFVKISVTDSGKGLDDDAKQRIFEPFYSAYSPARFESIGLASAYSTIKSHKGIINVYSEIGHGTTFTFYLPTSKKERLSQTGEFKLQKGNETILLVDDDETVAKSVKDILEHVGYQVMIAGSGDEAVEIYKEYCRHIHLVMLDIILPDINGDQVYPKLKAINANVLVILISGYSVNKQINVLLNQGCTDFIQKPFQTQSLTTKIRQALDRTHQKTDIGLAVK
jgi:signal transduction histidine kinase/CheY-like chemotaxis protein